MKWGIGVIIMLGMMAAAVRLQGSASEQMQLEPANIWKGHLVVKTFNSGFPQAHDTYNGISCASDANVYYVLSSEKFDVGAKVFRFDTKTEKIEMLADLTEACGEKDLKAIPQGKSHVSFVERNGKLFFATHIGYYSIVDGMETMGIPPEGYKPYPGGHLMCYDMKSGLFESLALAPEREGILVMNMDTNRGRIFGLTWPSGIFFRYNLQDKDLRSFGKVCALGEAGKGAQYRTICRSIAVSPDDGSAWFTTSEGTIMRYAADTDTLAPVQGEDMKKDYFGIYDPTSAGHMGYNWRQVFWHRGEKVVYGVHGNSGYLFRFNPVGPRLEVLERLTSVPSRRSGMFDQFSYGYLGFAAGPEQKTIFYLTGGPIYKDGKRVAGKSSTAMGEAKGLENLHLVTYDIRNQKYSDHGPIFYPNGDRPLYVNSIAVGKDNTVYTLARITEEGRTRTDLVRVRMR